MITVTAYFLVWCYTSTIASCQTIANLPNAQACTDIFAKIKAKRIAARIETCDTYPLLYVSSTGTLPK